MSVIFGNRILKVAAPGVSAPSIPTITDKALQAQFNELRGLPGGGQMWVQGTDGRCKGWLRVMGTGGGTNAWRGSKVKSPVIVPSNLACAISAQLLASPYSTVDVGLPRTSEWPGAIVRAQKPWTYKKSVTPIRSAFVRAIFGV